MTMEAVVNGVGEHASSYFMNMSEHRKRSPHFQMYRVVRVTVIVLLMMGDDSSMKHLLYPATVPGGPYAYLVRNMAQNTVFAT